MVATYQYYTSEYYGRLIEKEEFDRLSTRAQKAVEQFTAYRAQEDKIPQLPERVQDQVKDCICAVAELEYIVEQNEKVARGAQQSQVIKSRSVGAVSESYDVPKSQYANMNYLEMQQAKAAMMRDMLSPRDGINLISRVIR